MQPFMLYIEKIRSVLSVFAIEINQSTEVLLEPVFLTQRCPVPQTAFVAIASTIQRSGNLMMTSSTPRQSLPFGQSFAMPWLSELPPRIKYAYRASCCSSYLEKMHLTWCL